MKIMEIGLTALQDIGTNYSVRLSEKELLIYEEDDNSKVNKSEY